MTIELALCLIFMVIAAPVSRSISAHYTVFALANALMIGVMEADASFLAAFFAVLAIADAAIIAAGGRAELMLSAAISAALSIEQMINEDYLLSHVATLSVIANIALVSRVAVEYREWMRTKHGRW